ncbi:uncharacterized protein BDZ99DRAFT_27653 [Mytilinidion resinicola]|uniref:Uncharacterized protein n=1 Tax=Mytilinidion resinicola TaxID=574789 RepID=A0A6A6YLC8_9PEZI|nr:uncharacterized protein BDZ99DRAFT_27653 [Mytilinidion resinicola]KAF2809349.1 hypothetical protein BDZ99DRAFT_27653 [Mytilinidion resinicola]
MKTAHGIMRHANSGSRLEPKCRRQLLNVAPTVRLIGSRLSSLHDGGRYVCLSHYRGGLNWFALPCRPTFTCFDASHVLLRLERVSKLSGGILAFPLLLYLPLFKSEARRSSRIFYDPILWSGVEWSESSFKRDAEGSSWWLLSNRESSSYMEGRFGRSVGKLPLSADAVRHVVS